MPFLQSQSLTTAQQSLLASESASSASATVSLPQGTTSLIISVAESTGAIVPSVTGTTTGITYPVILMPTNNYEVPGTDEVMVAMVLPSQDPEVTIDFPGGAPGSPWFVIADTGIRAVVELTLRACMGEGGVTRPNSGLQILGSQGTTGHVIQTDSNGNQWTLPRVPGTTTNDHPGTEVEVSSQDVSATTNILAAPGAGKRYRIFSVQIVPITGTFIMNVYDSVSDRSLAAGCQLAPTTAQIPAQGFPLSENAALVANFFTGSGSAFVIVYWTEETV